MPRAKKRKKAVKKKRPALPLLGRSKGQRTGFEIEGSKLVISRKPDTVRVKKPPKKQTIIYE